jgi:hypothetical protein
MQVFHSITLMSIGWIKAFGGLKGYDYTKKIEAGRPVIFG